MKQESPDLSAGASIIIMLGMGLGLTLDDFKRVLVELKAVILGLITQLNKSQI